MLFTSVITSIVIKQPGAAIHVDLRNASIHGTFDQVSKMQNGIGSAGEGQVYTGHLVDVLNTLLLFDMVSQDVGFRVCSAVKRGKRHTRYFLVHLDFGIRQTLYLNHQIPVFSTHILTTNASFILR